jgi:D-tyrosyl-tRNA(Tyr) deacylase
MRILIQRVEKAFVFIENSPVAAIGAGLLVFVGIEENDTNSDIDYLTSKMLNLRIFDDQNEVMNLSLLDVGGDLLVVSQFTLHASTAKGNRPSYIKAAKPEISKGLYEQFCRVAEEKLGKKLFTGVFGADMQVSLVNDGPVTIWIDSKQREY